VEGLNGRQKQKAEEGRKKKAEVRKKKAKSR